MQGQMLLLFLLLFLLMMWMLRLHGVGPAAALMWLLHPAAEGETELPFAAAAAGCARQADWQAYPARVSYVGLSAEAAAHHLHNV